MCIWFLPGEDAATSTANIYKWLDDVAMSGKVCSDNLTKNKDGGREKGWFHKLKLNDATSFEESVRSKLEQWGAEATMQNKSCGRAYKTIGGYGKGELEFVQTIIGPFRS